MPGELIVAAIAALIMAGMWFGFKLYLKRQLAAAAKAAEQGFAKTLTAEKAQLESWRQREEETLEGRVSKMAAQKAHVSLQQWKLEEESKIRADAILRSAAVSKGKILEHLAAFMSSFKYHPADARFLGSPVDLIVFDGLADGKLEGIRFLEIKTGKSRLTGREEEIRKCIEERRVSWEQIKVD